MAGKINGTHKSADTLLFSNPILDVPSSKFGWDAVILTAVYVVFLRHVDLLYISSSNLVNWEVSWLSGP
jgi:hypothetical protein